MKTHTLVLLAALPALAACGAAATTPAERRAPVATAEIVCVSHGTRIVTPAVRPHRDGVHLRILNRTRRDLSVLVEQADGAGSGTDAPVGVRSWAWPLHPGRIGVACFSKEQDPSAVRRVSFQVVDPAELWRSTALGCPRRVGVNADYAAGATGSHDLVAGARAALGSRLRPTDAVEVAGYPRQAQPVVRVVRSGKTVATVSFDADGRGGWLATGFEACSSFGLESGSG